MSPAERSRAVLPLVLAVAGALLALPRAAAQQSPLIEATFHIDPASQLADPDWLEAGEIRQAQDRLSKLLTAHCSNHFGFVRWRAVLPQQPVSRKVPRLTLRLHDVERSSGTEITVGFFKAVARREEPITGLTSLTLIPTWKLERPDTVDELYDLVAGMLEGAAGRFEDESFRSALHSGFLKDIPLAREIIADPEAKRVVVRLRWDAVHAAADSVLEVRFLARCSAAQDTSGRMKLSLIARRAGGSHLGLLQSAITFFDCAPLTLEGAGAWSDEVPQLLLRASDIKVLMETYIREGSESAAGPLTEPH